MASSSQPARSAVSSPSSRTRPLIKPASTLVVKGLNLVARRGEAVVRHQPYPILGASGGKVNANKIHNEGTYKPQACTRCLGSISKWKGHQTVGVGASSFNELFSYGTLLAGDPRSNCKLVAA